MNTHENILKLINNHETAFVHGIRSLLSFYQICPLNKVDNWVATKIIDWINKGKEVTSDWKELGKDICIRNIDYLVEIANFKEIEKQNKSALNFSKENSNNDGYGS